MLWSALKSYLGISRAVVGIRRLHLGGIEPLDGWEIFNAVKGPHVDHVGNAMDLRRFPDASFDSLYASHILEHFDYQGDLLKTLREWRRVLKPGGELLISVPDMETLSRLWLEAEPSLSERILLMRMIFGGHMDRYDYHLVGFDFSILAAYLSEAGFCRVDRVERFGLVQDSSESSFKGVPISLNVIAR